MRNARRVAELLASAITAAGSLGGEHRFRRIGQPRRDRLRATRSAARARARRARGAGWARSPCANRLIGLTTTAALIRCAISRPRSGVSRRAVSRCVVALQRVPVGHLPIEELVDRQRRAEIDVHAPVFAPQAARDAAASAPSDSPCFGCPSSSATSVRPSSSFLVAEVHGHEQQRPRMLAHEALDGHAEEAALRRERPAAAAAAALDEVRDREALGEHRVQVFAEHRGVQRLALEAPAQEEGAAAPQERAHERKIEVGACRDVRRREPLRVDEVRQQQVVDVAAMVGQVDEPLARRDLDELAAVMDLDAVVEAAPEPREHQLHRAHDRIAEIRRDLPRELARALPSAAAVGHAEPRATPPRSPPAMPRTSTIDSDQVAPVRQIGSDRRLAHPAKVEAQEAIGLAHRRALRRSRRRSAAAARSARRSVTCVCRPCRTMIASWRSGPTLAHASAKSAFTSESCDPGERPHSTVTGTSWMSSAGSRSSAAVICASVADGSAVRVLSGLRLRITENTARSPAGNSGPIGASAEGKPSRRCLLLEHEEARQLPVLEHVAERTLRIDVQPVGARASPGCGRRGTAGAGAPRGRGCRDAKPRARATGRAGESVIVVSGFAARTSSSFSMRKWRP